MDIGRYIKELLMMHDCVILPGLGGFIANYKPAGMHSSQKRIYPPSKQILFNRNLVHNDGLLYGYASKESGYGYKDVRSLAEAYIRQIKKDVTAGKKFIIDELGYFYRDREKQFQFSAEPTSNLLADSYGLPFVRYKEFEPRIISTRRSYTSFPAEPDPRMTRRRIRRIALSAAAACLTVLLVMGPIRTMYFSEAGIEITAGDSFHPAVNPATLAAQPAATLSHDASTQPESATYHIIVGSFKDFGNARELRNVMVSEGYQARILAGGSNYYRVSASQSVDRAEANRNLATIRSLGHESAWMLSN